MKWEASRKTTTRGSTTVTEIELTPEGKKALTIDPVPYLLMKDKDREKRRKESRRAYRREVVFDIVVTVGVIVVIVAVACGIAKIVEGGGLW